MFSIEKKLNLSLMFSQIFVVKFEGTIMDYFAMKKLTNISAFFVVIVTVCGVCLANDEYCYDNAIRACSSTNKFPMASINCTAKYGAIEAMEKSLQKYVNHHFIRSFEYLLMSTHYGNYEKNRPGFEKLFRSLSDSTWKNAIELIQYITMRGGEMNFNLISTDILAEESSEPNFELYELQSIAKALDIEKQLANEAHRIHGEAGRKNNNFHDPEISYHMEQEFMPKHRDIIRKLAGYTSDLSTLLKGPDSSLSLFLFDDYLLTQSFI